MLTNLFSTSLALLLAISTLRPGDSLAPGAHVAAASQVTATARSGGVMFIENAGQFADGVRFQAWAGPGALWLAEDALWITVLDKPDAATRPADLLRESRRGDAPDAVGDPLAAALRQPLIASSQQAVNLKLSFPGANPHPRLEPFDRLATHVSYFIGADPARWHADVPVWGGVRYVNLYPGVDLEITGASGQWEWRLVEQISSSALPLGRTPSPTLPLREGGSEDDIRLRVEGADAVTVDGEVLRLTTPLGELALPLLQAAGVQVASAQVESLPERPATFDVHQPFTGSTPAARAASTANDDPARPGDLLYATFLGGSDYDVSTDIAVDSTGQAYVTGYTCSADFPAATGPGYGPTYNCTRSAVDAFVIKLDATGTRLVYATFLGGSESDWGDGIAVDRAGQAYVTGSSQSTDFPAAAGPGYDSFYHGSGDAFVVNLDAIGSTLRYATFLGGSEMDWGYEIATDGTGNAYVTGSTRSADFPAIFGPGYNTNFSGSSDVFAVKLDPDGMELPYATFLGGRYNDWSTGITVDGSGQAYVTGGTQSTDFPAVHGPGYDTTLNGLCDAFVIKLDAAGVRLVYATFLGGNDYDSGSSIAVNTVGQAYVTGSTRSADFPAARGPGYDTTFNGFYDAFVVKLDATGARLVYATFLGGNNYDDGSRIAVDAVGRTYVAGSTFSEGFPATCGPGYDTSINDGNSLSGDRGDGFVVKLNTTGTRLLYATFLGGNTYDRGYGITVNDVGHVYITGQTESADFLAARGPGYDTTFNGFSDAFVVKLATALPELIAGVIWLDANGDGARGPGEPGIPGVQVCAQPMGRTAPLCATTSADGAYEIRVPAPATYLIAPVNPPAGMTPTTRGFYLPVALAQSEQFRHADFGFK